MEWPSLSVIIPSYNQGGYIERTLLSIFKQNYPGALQVIVSDGGSTDETLAVLKRYPQVQWWSERDAGFVDAVTKGLVVATGEIIAIQSSDDYYLEGAFEKAISVLRDDQDLVFVTGNEVRIQEDGQVAYPTALPSVTMLGPGALICRTPAMNVPQHATFVRRSAVDRVGGLRQEVDYCADFDLWYRVLHFGRAVILPDTLAACQIHPTQRTQNKAEVWIVVLKKVIEDAESDPIYARQFQPTPETKRDIFRQWEILWNRAAGGKEGVRKSRVLADDSLMQTDVWPDYVRDFIRGYASEPPPEPTPAPEPTRGKHWTHAILLKIKQNAAVRAMFGRHPLSGQVREEDMEAVESPIEAPLRQIVAEPPTEPVKETVDIDWWRETPAFKTTKE